MASIKVIPKKRGRPATGKDPLIGFRVPPNIAAAIEKFASEEEDRPARSEAIRRILKDWLVAHRYLPYREDPNERST